jgi:hypothetical protein
VVQWGTGQWECSYCSYCRIGRILKKVLSITEMRILLLVIKFGPNALFCMPNRANCALLLSVMMGLDGQYTVAIMLISAWSGPAHISSRGSASGVDGVGALPTGLLLIGRETGVSALPFGKSSPLTAVGHSSACLVPAACVGGGPGAMPRQQSGLRDAIVLGFLSH